MMIRRLQNISMTKDFEKHPNRRKISRDEREYHSMKQGDRYPDLLSPEAWDEAARDFHLTGQELNVLKLLCSGNGNGNDGIELRMGIKQNTVRTHLKSIYAKLGCHDRAAAILLLLHGYKRS